MAIKRREAVGSKKRDGHGERGREREREREKETRRLVAREEQTVRRAMDPAGKGF